jgi:hypothetical protein
MPTPTPAQSLLESTLPKRCLLVLACLQLLFLFASALYPSFSSFYAWMGLSPTWPHFQDLHVITQAWTWQDSGVDPLMSPLSKVLFNYPRLWLLPGRLGLTEGTFLPLSLLTCGGFLLSAVLLGSLGNVRSLVATALVLLSGSCWLALERANTDLLIFCLLTAAVLLDADEGRRPWLVAALLLLAALLKLYPALAFPLLWRRGDRHSLLRMLAVGLLFALYLVLTWGDILQIFSKTGTGKGDSLSFGVSLAATFITYFSSGGRILGPSALHACQAGMAILVLGGLLTGWRWKSATIPRGTLANAFLLGSAIFLCTMLQGNSWAYRLVFLLPCVALLGKFSLDGRGRRPALATCCLLLGVMTPWLLCIDSVPLIIAGHLCSLLLMPALAVLTGLALRGRYGDPGSQGGAATQE